MVINRYHPFYIAEELPAPRLVATGGASASAAPVGTNTTGRWVKAHDLLAGDRLLTAPAEASAGAEGAGAGLSGEGWAEVRRVGVERRPLVAFNLTVADFHTFFVRAPGANDNDAVWVHNSSKGLTEPKLPSKLIVEQDGVRIVHYYRSNDHGPAHLHVKGQGQETRVGQNGKPLKGDPELSSIQEKVINQNKALIRRAVDKIQRWHQYRESAEKCVR